MIITRPVFKSIFNRATRGAINSRAKKTYLLAAMLSDLGLTRGTGVPTLARASASYTVDYAGQKQKMPAGAACFPGQRVVKNLLTYSEFTGGLSTGWTLSSSSVVIPPIVPPVGTYALKVTYAFSYQSIVAKPGEYCLSAYVLNGPSSGSNPLPRVSLAFINATGGLISSDVVTFSTSSTTDWRRVRNNGTAPVGTASINIYVVKNGDTNGDTNFCYFTGIQVEDVTNQPNQNPSEYVSTNVLSYHGLGVDGIKAFPYLNPYTVDVNGVVTDSGVRTPITGTKGLSLQPATVNKCTCWGIPRLDALSAELVVNAADREFSSDTGYWTKNDASITISGGVVNLISAPSNKGISKSVFLTPGKVYSITYTIVSISSGGIKTWAGLSTTSPERITTGTYTDTLLCAGDATVRFYSTMTSTTATIDNISIKEAIDYVGTKAYYDGTVFQNPILNMTLSGDTTAVLSIAADQTAIDSAIAAEIAKGVSAWDESLLVALELASDNGYKVYKLDNSLGAAYGFVDIAGPANSLAHSLSAPLRLSSGNGRLRWNFGTANSVLVSNTSYAKVSTNNSTPDTTGRIVRFQADPYSVLYFLDPQLEELPFATMTTPSEGASMSRAADILSYPVAGNIPLTGRRFFTDYWTPKSVVAGRTEVIRYSGVDASNYIKVASNGVIVFFEKRVAGVSEFVTFALSPTAGVQYRIDAWFNADNSMGLRVNGASAGAGWGLEKIVNGGFDTDTSWIKGVGVTIANSIATFSNNDGVSGVKQSVLTPNSIYKLTFEIKTVIAGAFRPFIGALAGPTTTTIGINTHTAIATTSATAAVYGSGNPTSGTLDNISVKEVYNSSTTAAPVFGTSMFVGSDGANGSNAQYMIHKNTN